MIPLWARITGAIGRVFIATGLLMLAFVAYQLWGTGIQTQRAQSQLAREFAQSRTNTPTRDVPLPGGVIGIIEIPRIGISKYVVNGVKYKDLAKGPGVFPGSPMPGGGGNLAIAGHRTTSGAPFGDIDKLKAGDKINITTAIKTFTYSVTGSKIVPPTDVSVVATTDRSVASITLVSCYPKYSSSKRIIVTGTLDTAPDPDVTSVVTESPTGSTAKVTALDNSWFRDHRAIAPTLIYASALAVLWTLTWMWQRMPPWRKRRWWLVYPVSSIPTLVLLYFFFENLSRLMPSNI